ncbi:transcriptional repressor LexA [Candidatus Omnitrophota bacterium]
MEIPLTPKQNQVLRFIAKKIWHERRPPTIREIGQNFHFSSTGTVRDYLRTLQNKGYLKLTKKKARAIEIINQKLLQLPIVAQVYAGSPTLTYEDIEGYLDLERLILKDGNQFALRAKGESMIEAGIMPDDLLLVRKQNTCATGDIVVALVDNEATVKYFRKHKNKIYLQPANKNYTPILIKDNFHIIGKVISVIRNYV